MSDFGREYPIEFLTDTVLEQNSWFTDLLFRWHPAGDAANSSVGDTEGVLARDCVCKSKMQHLRAAFREKYMNFYCGGQSIARVGFGRTGIQAKIHEKYVYGFESTAKNYVGLTSAGFRERGTGQLLHYGDQHLNKWIENANRKIGKEKRFVDLVVAHNRDVIDLEMGLPAYSEVRRAPRMDLVALELDEGGWRVVLWEIKLVADPRVRCEGDKQPEVLKQLESYTKWLSDTDRASRVADAYQRNCRLLMDLHNIAKRFRPDIEELGPGIKEVAASDVPPLVDPKPRLLIIYDKKDTSFRDRGHLDKLRNAGWCVKTVQSLSELALSGQS